MILPADQARQIQRGQRTTIRVPVDTRLLASPLRPARKGHAKPFVPIVSELLQIAHPVTRACPNGGPDKNGRETLCFTRITHVARGPLGDLTEDEAHAEGCDTPDEFRLTWMRRYDRDWFTRQIQQLIEADIDPDDAAETVCLMALNRWPDRWAKREVWTITVQVETDLDYSLAPSASPKGDTCYILGGSDPIEAGTLPVGTLAARWSRRAARSQLEAIADELSPRERAIKARQLSRRVRALTLQDPRLTQRIEELVRNAEREAA